MFSSEITELFECNNERWVGLLGWAAGPAGRHGFARVVSPS
ncbi:hypothetical protein ACPPVO_23350 [Dactylosporangium sp. McL0621]